MRRLAGWVVLVAACVAPAQDTDERSADRQALFRAWSVGPEEYRAAAARMDWDQEMAQLWAEDMVVVMVASYRAEGVAAIGEQGGRFERARRELKAMGALAVEPLVEMVLVGNDVGAKLATDLLTEGGERSAASLLAGALDGAPQRSRLRAVTALAGLAYAGEGEAGVVDRLVAVLSGDPAWICRVQAARSLVSRADAAGEVVRVCGALSRGLVDPEPSVQIACCRALAELGDEQVVPALINHLERLVYSGAGLDRLRAVQAALGELTRSSRSDLTPAEWREVWVGRRESRGG